LRDAKLKDLEMMIAYVETSGSRMKFLCDYLGDDSNHQFNNCDNTSEKKLMAESNQNWLEKLQTFRDNFFPELDVEGTKVNLVNGVAASYYGFSGVGESIHRSKYGRGGDFPDFLLTQVVKAFRSKFGREKFDIILFVPPTESGDLVKNFATKLSQVLQIPLSLGLKKIRLTSKQKIFDNGFLKKSNIKDAFAFEGPEEISGKTILLFDDVFDSGATIKEIGRLLSNLGASKIAPIVIAKTVGGDTV
jgi:ATP-dependent DNA helicase RecQ